MYTLRRVFAFLAVVGFVLGFVGDSQAQLGGATVTLPKTGVQRRANRGNNLLNTQINYDDCHLGEVISFSVALSGYSGYSLQVWAGANCDNITNRTTTTTLQCWQIGEGISPSSINPPALQVPVREILFGRTLASGTSTGNGSATGGSGGDGSGGAGTAGADSGGTAGAGTAGAGTAGATSSTDDPACTDKNGATAAQNITVYFMLVDGASAIQGTFATWAGLYKLLAPAPPTKVSAGIGENLLPITFTGDSSDTTILGYNFYCDPPPGLDFAKDAGILPDPDLPLPNCVGSTKLIAGTHPDSANLCGSTGKSSSRGNATNLVNGIAYNVAVATTDNYGNTGVLSATTCAVPQPVTGFFEAYRDAGGEGGGGFCSFSRHREPLTLIALLGFASFWVLRRRRTA